MKLGIDLNTDLPAGLPLPVTTITSGGVEKPMPEVSPVQKMKLRHESIANALAEGLSKKHVATLFSISLPTIDRLLLDPTFQAYVELNKEKAYDRQKLIGHDASLIRNTLLEQIGNDIETGDLTFDQKLKAFTILSDRTGLGPSSQVEVKLGGLGDELTAALARQASYDKSTIIDGIPVEDVEPNE